MTTALVIHPGAELFGSDRMLLESVRGLVGVADVVVALPEQGPLVAPLLEAGARVVIVPMLVVRKALLRPRAWGRLASSAVRGFAAAVRLIRRTRPDVIYVSTVTIPQWPLTARMSGVPVVSHVHEAEASGSVWVNRLLYSPHLACRALLINSAFSLETLRRAVPGLAARTTIVLNGVESPEAPAPARAELDTLHIAYVGRLSPRKGPDLAVSALALLRDRGTPADLILIGSVFPGYEWYQTELEQAISAKGLGDAVTFTGFVPDVWPLLAAADVVVVPSRLDEPFGNTAVEAVLASRPVVASATSGLREAVDGYPTARLVAPGDAEELATALADVRQRWAELAAKVENSRTMALSRHAPAIYRATVARIVIGAVSR